MKPVLHVALMLFNILENYPSAVRVSELASVTVVVLQGSRVLQQNSTEVSDNDKKE